MTGATCEADVLTGSERDPQTGKVVALTRKCGKPSYKELPASGVFRAMWLCDSHWHSVQQQRRELFSERQAEQRA